MANIEQVRPRLRGLAAPGAGPRARGQGSGAQAREDGAQSPFAFLRGTFWRWAETILRGLPGPGGMQPPSSAVGDIHLENFGTWRDDDGRLVWGVNDFDEAAEMPYALDLVRLATSALLASHRASVRSRGISCDCHPRGLRARACVRRRPSSSTAIGPGCASCWPSRTSSAPSSGARSRRPSTSRRRRAIARALADAMPRAAPRHAHRAPHRRHWQPGSAALDRRGRMARRPGRARAQGRCCFGLAAGASTRRRAIRCAEIANGRFRANDPWYRHEATSSCAAFPPTTARSKPTGRRRAAHARHAGRHGTRARQRASGHVHRAAIVRDLEGRKDDWLRANAKQAAAAVTRDFEDWKAT